MFTIETIITMITINLPPPQKHPPIKKVVPSKEDIVIIVIVVIIVIEIMTIKPLHYTTKIYTPPPINVYSVYLE